MAEIDSPLGKKTFTSTPRRILTVENTEDDFGPADLGPPDNYFPDNFPQMQPGVPVELTADQFRDLQAKRAQILAAQKKASPDARQRIDILTGIGRITKEFSLDGHTFVIQSLKARDLREIIVEASKVSNIEVNFVLRAQTLARSLIKIDGHEVGLVIGNNTLEARLALLDELDEGTLSYIHQQYSEMNKEHQEKFGIKNEEDAKEVVEQVKK